MGIPGFNSWFYSNNQQAYQSLQHTQTDHLYIDMNSVLHNVLRKGNKGASSQVLLHATAACVFLWPAVADLFTASHHYPCQLFSKTCWPPFYRSRKLRQVSCYATQAPGYDSENHQPPQECDASHRWSCTPCKATYTEGETQGSRRIAVSHIPTAPAHFMLQQ